MEFVSLLKPKEYVIGIVGSEAADCDSIVCALSLAAFRSLMNLDENVAFLPFVQCSFDDLKLRRETVILLSMQQIPLDTLRTTEDVQDVSEWILVDHNVANFPNCKVIEIIDHHFDYKIHDLAKRKIAFEGQSALVGSCCTLIAEEVLSQKEASAIVNGDGKNTDVLLKILHLLLGVILIDTANLTPDNGKTTDRDVEAVKLIREILKLGPDQTNEIFTKLHFAKADPLFWSGMNSDEMLR